MSAAGKREVLEAVIREQLREAWERGLATAPNGPSALADACAPGGFALITVAVDRYLAAVVDRRLERMTPDALRARLRLAEATADADRRTA